jgi:hypothetical protein
MSSEGQPTIRLAPETERWEYRVILIGTEGLFGPKVNVEQIGTYLNQVGEDGWELISTTPITRGDGRTSELLCILKRRIRA